LTLGFLGTGFVGEAYGVNRQQNDIINLSNSLDKTINKLLTTSQNKHTKKATTNRKNALNDFNAEKNIFKKELINLLTKKITPHDSTQEIYTIDYLTQLLEKEWQSTLKGENFEFPDQAREVIRKHFGIINKKNEYRYTVDHAAIELPAISIELNDKFSIEITIREDPNNNNKNIRYFTVVIGNNNLCFFTDFKVEHSDGNNIKITEVHETPLYHGYRY